MWESKSRKCKGAKSANYKECIDGDTKDPKLSLKPISLRKSLQSSRTANLIKRARKSVYQKQKVEVLKQEQVSQSTKAIGNKPKMDKENVNNFVRESAQVTQRKRTAKGILNETVLKEPKINIDLKDTENMEPELSSKPVIVKRSVQLSNTDNHIKRLRKSIIRPHNISISKEDNNKLPKITEEIIAPVKRKRRTTKKDLINQTIENDVKLHKIDCETITDENMVNYYIKQKYVPIQPTQLTTIAEIDTVTVLEPLTNKSERRKNTTVKKKTKVAPLLRFINFEDPQYKKQRRQLRHKKALKNKYRMPKFTAMHQEMLMKKIEMIDQCLDSDI